MKTTTLLAPLVSLLLVPALASAQGGLAGLLKSASDAVTDAASDVSQTLSGVAGGKSKAGAASGKTAAPAVDDEEDAEPPAVASTGAISFGKPKAEAPADLVTVTAKGQGESVDAAKKDAVRNAIKKAVGELVDAKTLVENDELVEDKILTLSNAMVEKADYGDAKSVGDGLFEVPVTAVVKKGQLNRELKAVGIATGAVKGDSLAASLFSGKERVANAEKFFGERLKDFPGNVVEAVMLAKEDGSPNIEVDTDKGHVYANVGLRVNMENYAKWTQALCELLGQICVEKEETRLPFIESKSGGSVYWGSGEKKGFDGEEVPLKNCLKEQKPDCREVVAVPVIVATPAATKVKRSTWPATIYYLDPQMFMALSRQLFTLEKKSGHVEVALMDEDNEIVCSKWVDFGDRWSSGAGFRRVGNGFPMAAEIVDVNSRYDDKPSRSNYVLVTPVLKHRFKFVSVSSFSYSRELDPVLSLRVDLGKVSEEDIASVAGYEVKVEYK